MGLIVLEKTAEWELYLPTVSSPKCFLGLQETETRVLYVHLKYSLNLAKMHSCSQLQVFYHTHAALDPADKPDQIKEEWTKPTKLPPRFPYHH